MLGKKRKEFKSLFCSLLLFLLFFFYQFSKVWIKNPRATQIQKRIMYAIIIQPSLLSNIAIAARVIIDIQAPSVDESAFKRDSSNTETVYAQTRGNLRS